ncbi:-acylglycerol-3-phosphate O-acyltransferase ABHD5 [Xyrichtys novacula]|uniref:-acylglycerol-3-phosphate O-acyltransferase ABHD5 n=1 Tax=Xyrichtys novacula TaxID=13765 RepID=A0AAV1HCK1_XYRNO|nr:-acylglycerol-3-phosphate O-acyltransferase ABHD5 [Xyrichtys novacula]
MPAASTQISQTEPVNRSVEMLRAEMRVEDGQSQWKSERKERKEEASRESETVRLAIINHIRCWRQQCILATRQTLRLSTILILSSAKSLVALNTHTALGHGPKTHGTVRFVRTAN